MYGDCLKKYKETHYSGKYKSKYACGDKLGNPTYVRRNPPRWDAQEKNMHKTHDSKKPNPSKKTSITVRGTRQDVLKAHESKKPNSYKKKIVTMEYTR